MVSSGMKAVGYEYIVIDDCWHGERMSKVLSMRIKQNFRQA